MSVTLPAPETLFEITWLIVGFMFARSIAKPLDHYIMELEEVKKLRPVWSKLISMLLDFLHHFWIGLLLMVYNAPTTATYWFGYGLFVDDLPDLPPRFVKMFIYFWPQHEEENDE